MRQPTCVATIAAAAFASLALMSACTTGEDPGFVVGQLESDRIELAAEAAERVTEWLAAEGAVVTTGQPLLSQDAAIAKSKLAQAEADVALRHAELDELLQGTRIEQLRAARAEVAGAVKERDFRDAELKRIGRLEARKLASPDQLDQAQAALDAAAAVLAVGRARLSELESGARAEAIRRAEAALLSVEAIAAQRRIALSRLTIAAPVDGVLERYLFEPGERPAIGQVLAIVLAGTQPHARVYIPADVRTRVAAGQSVTVRVEGLEDTLEGHVSWVSADAAYTPYFALTERDRGRLSYLAKIELPPTAQRLPDGVPVEAEFHALRNPAAAR